MSSHVWLKRALYIALILISLAAFKGLDLYRKAFSPNIYLNPAEKTYLYIKTGWTYDDVMAAIEERQLVKNMNSLKWVAQKKNYSAHVNPGRYRIKTRMSNNDLINLLRSGQQEPVELTFNNIRTLEQFAGIVDEQLEMDSGKLLAYLKSEKEQKKLGFDRYTINCMLIPDTYEVYWNISVEDFLVRMSKEYDAFWNNRRSRKAEGMGLTREEVITLASIVNEETRKNDEKARIAGVYINRLKRGIRLHADPTVIYALGDFNVKRVLRKHYQIDSPFNTYLVDGLPPGPICLPDISSIDAVLNYEKHDYIYFCARPDFSGYHNFARTLEEHNRNAALYRSELNKRRIYR
jgi:UPF0755 protein